MKKLAKFSPEPEISRKVAGESIFVQVLLQKLGKAILVRKIKKALRKDKKLITLPLAK